MVNKAEQIAELRSTEPRQKMLKILNYLGEIFNGPTEGKGLKILSPNQMLIDYQLLYSTKSRR